MVVGGEIPGRGNGAKAQSQESTGSGWDSGCMCIGEPGQVGMVQVVGGWKVKPGVWSIVSVLGEASRGCVCARARTRV